NSATSPWATACQSFTRCSPMSHIGSPSWQCKPCQFHELQCSIAAIALGTRRPVAEFILVAGLRRNKRNDFGTRRRDWMEGISVSITAEARRTSRRHFDLRAHLGLVALSGNPGLEL